MSNTYTVTDTKFRTWVVTIPRRYVELRHRGVKWQAQCQTATLDGQDWLLTHFEHQLWNPRQKAPFDRSLFIVARADGKAVCGHRFINDALSRVKPSLL